ncbi:MAG TPA: insulinase family protein [Ignavibacteriaceae bacterium]|nr:insulinase family protein [Ignavibacteriaceae bacterium]
MKKNKAVKILVTFLVTLIFQTSCIFAQNSTQADKIQPLPKGISIYQLDNGMKVLLIENPALPMVGSNVVIKIGSAYENFSTSGMSHMLEHLLFNGTTSRDQKQLYDDVDRIGGYNNAHTDNYYTDFMMVTPAGNIKKGLEIQADMLFNSTLPEEKFKKEKGIVLEEISKSLADPLEQLERNTISVLYPGHALSLPTLGTYSTIESMSRDEVNKFYKNNYVPNNMVLSVIGNFRTKEMLVLIKEIFGNAKPGNVIHENNSGWATGFQKPGSISENPVSHRFYEGTDKVIQLFYKLPDNETSECFNLMETIFEKKQIEFQSSLKKEFPDKLKSIKLSLRTSPFSDYVEAKVTLNKNGNNIDLNKVAGSVEKKIASLDFHLPDETVKSEATKERTDFLKNVEKPHMFGIYNSDPIVKEGIESVLASFNGNKYTEAAKLIAGLKLKAPAKIIIQSPIVKDENENSGSTGNALLFKDDATGKRLIVVQNEASDILAIHYLLKHKAALENKYGKDAAEILHDCLGQRLTSDANQAASKKYGFTYTVNDNPYIPMDNIYLHPDFGYIRAEGLADDMPGAIKYINNQIKNFVPTEAEFKKAVEKFKGIEMMSMGGDKAKKLFDSKYKSLVYEPDPYSGDQPELTYQNLLAFEKEYFNPSNMIVSVVSPGSPSTVNSLFADFATSKTKNQSPAFSPTFKLNDNPITIDTSGGGERSYLSWGFIKQIDPKDAPALQALSLVLSDDIIFEIREKQGMAYHMSAGIDVINDKALFFISQGTRPQNVDKLVPQYPGFFDQSVLDNLTQDEVEKSINMYLGRMMFRRLSSINQAYYLGYSLYFDNDFNYDKQFLDALKNIKLADVKNAAKKYMKIENPISLIVR